MYLIGHQSPNIKLGGSSSKRVAIILLQDRYSTVLSTVSSTSASGRRALTARYCTVLICTALYCSVLDCTVRYGRVLPCSTPKGTYNCEARLHSTLSNVRNFICQIGSTPSWKGTTCPMKLVERYGRNSSLNFCDEVLLRASRVRVPSTCPS